MNTLLIQGASGGWLPVLNKILPQQQAYCTLHGITYMPFFGRIDHARHPNFDRFPPMIQALESGRFELVIWMDADALAVAPEVDLREAADEFTHIGLVAHPGTWGRWGFHFNCGVMYVRKTTEAVNFLREVYRIGPIDGPAQWHNQNTIHTLLDDNFASLRADRIRNRWNCSAVNNVPNPVVRAFHGMGPEKALVEIAKLLEVK